MRKQPDRLDRITDAPAQRLGLDISDVLASDPDRPGIDRDQPIDHPQGRRFAATGGAEQHAKIPGRDGQRKPVDNAALAIGLCDLVDFDHGAKRRRSRVETICSTKVGGERQKNRRQRTEQNEIDGILAEPFKDKGSEPARADQRRDDRQADRLHGHDAQPGEQYRECERQFDLPEDLPRGQPHAAPRLDGGAIDAGQSHRGVANDRQQRIEHERDDRRRHADAADPKRSELRHRRDQRRQRHDQQSKQRDRRDGLQEIQNREYRALPSAGFSPRPPPAESR